MEKTLILLKPDAVKRSIIGEIISRFEKVGLKIVGCKMAEPDREHYHVHYEKIGKMISRRGEKIFENTLAMMQDGPVIAMVLEGVDAIKLVRKMVGDTEPHGASPGTIRGDFAHMSYNHGDKHDVGIPNVIHASGDKKDAEQEIYHWFNDSELFEYNTVHEQYMNGQLMKKSQKTNKK